MLTPLENERVEMLFSLSRAHLLISMRNYVVVCIGHQKSAGWHFSSEHIQSDLDVLDPQSPSVARNIEEAISAFYRLTLAINH